MKTQKKSRAIETIQDAAIIFFFIVGLTSMLILAVMGYMFMNGLELGIVGCSGSMEPTLGCGDLMLFQKFITSGNSNTTATTSENTKNILENAHIMGEYKKQNIKVGDIVSYKYYAEFSVIHRVVRVCEDGIITKGDNNQMTDTSYDCIPFWAVEGKYIKTVANVKWLLEWLNG